MSNKCHLLQQLIRIEMNNFKNICPFIYKNSRNEIRHVNTFYPTHDNKVTIINSIAKEHGALRSKSKAPT